MDDPFDYSPTMPDGVTLRWRRDARCRDHDNRAAYIRAVTTRELVAGEVLVYHRVEGRCRTEPCAWTDITEDGF